MTLAGDALLWKVSDAVAVPLALGEKVTVNGADCPAAIVLGNVRPDTTNSLLFVLADEIVTGAPVAAIVPINAEFAPTVTFPKLNVPGATVN